MSFSINLKMTIFTHPVKSASYIYIYICLFVCLITLRRRLVMAVEGWESESASHSVVSDSATL